VPFILEADGEAGGISGPAQITLHAGRVVIFTLRGTSDDTEGKRTVRLPYRVKNLWIAPDEALPVELKLDVTFGSNE
jgi:hypothetical protein